MECRSGSYSDGKETKYRKIIKSLNWSNRKKLTTRDYIMDHALLGLSQSVSEVSVRYGDYCNFIPWTCYPVPCIRYSQLSTKHYPQSLHPSLHRVVHHFQRFVGLLLHHLCWWCGSSLIDSDQVAQIKGKYSSIVCWYTFGEVLCNGKHNVKVDTHPGTIKRSGQALWLVGGFSISRRRMQIILSWIPYCKEWHLNEKRVIKSCCCINIIIIK